MSASPTLSIIIPAYNELNTLEEVVRRVAQVEIGLLKLHLFEQRSCKHQRH